MASHGPLGHESRNDDRKLHHAAEVREAEEQKLSSGEKSLGVVRVEQMNQTLSRRFRIVIFLCIFLLAWAYDFDLYLRFTFQSYAANEFGQSALQSSVNVARAVIAAAAQPTAAKIADVFGRLELICVALFFYVIGTVVSAVTPTLTGLGAGVILYQIGYTVLALLVEIVIADVSSTRARVFCSYIPVVPNLVIVWISGYVTTDIVTYSTWRWGIGMWAIIVLVTAIPFVLCLFLLARRARQSGRMSSYSNDARKQIRGDAQHVSGSAVVRLCRQFATVSTRLFWQLDVIGIILVIAALALILVPLTLAGGLSSEWNTGHIIAPIVIGFVCIPAFVFWELRAEHPLIPFRKLGDRAVWGPLGIALFLNFAWTLQGDYLYYILIVCFDFSILAATRISGLYTFCSVLAGALLGAVIYKVRRLKVFIIFGTILFLVAYGLLIRYRGSGDGYGRSGVIGAEVLLGIAGGFFPYPAQASIQAAVKHENLAVVTGIYLALYQVGSALGNAVSGAIWTQVLYGHLSQNLASINETLAADVYAEPLVIVPSYPIGTPARTAIIEAYASTQRILCITGICLTVPLIGFAFCLRDQKLNDKQNLVEYSESEASTSDYSVDKK